MSVFDKIKEAIFGRAQAAEATHSSSPTSPTAPVTSTPNAPISASPPPSANAAPKPTSSAPPASSSSVPSSSSTTSPVDIEAVMDAAVKSSGQKLNWRTSIVDMMKALNLDSSLTNREELAKELQYTGDTKDTSKMNVWLHKALLQKLAANGGKVPADLTD